MSKPSSYDATEPYMGTLFTLKAEAAHDPARAFRAAFNRIADLDNKLSDYKPDSELNRLCQAGHAVVSADLLIVLTHAQRLAADSGGAFDVTQGPVIRLWREARRLKRLPAPADLIDAADRSGYTHLDIRGHTVTLALPHMQLDLGGIAKGYAAGEALAVLSQHGIRCALVAASGDLAIGDPPTGKAGWRVGASGQTLDLHNCAVSTSGHSEQFADIDGVRYSHIIDPHTHRPLTTHIQVSVIARRGIDADALATALSVLGKDRGRELLRKYPDARAIFT